MSQITTEKLLADFKVLLNDAEQLVGATAGEVGERVADVRRRLARRVEAGRTALVRREEELRGRAQQVKGEAIDFMRDEGWRWLLAGACVGLLAGLALYCQKKGTTRDEP